MASFVAALTFPLGGDPDTSTFLVSTDIWASDLLELTFSVPLVANADLSDIRNYSITPVTNGVLPVTVNSVRVGNDSVTTQVFLVVSGITNGQEYIVLIERANNAYGTEASAGDTNLISAYGVHINGTILAGSDTKNFVARNTKIDNAVKGSTAIYDTSTDSLYRNVLNAIFRQDDLLGGSRNDRLP